MSAKYEKIMGEFCEEEELTHDKEFLSEQENGRITEEYVNGDAEVKENILNLYDYEYDDNTNQFHFYKLVPSGISKEEIDRYISVKTLQNLRQINATVRTIKSIAVFWLILSLISVVIFAIGFLAVLLSR